MSEEELYKLLNIPYKPWIELTDEEIQLFEKNNNYIKQLQQENSQLKQQLEDLCLNLMHTDKIKTNYVRAFEELFNFYENDLKGMQSKNDVMVLGRLKYLKKKYNLGGE